jgi:hypothetical protein
MAQRIAYEQKMLCGKWVEQQADFPSVLKGVDFCADMNAKAGAYRYRVKVVADPNGSNEAAPRSARYDEIMARFAAA